MIKRFWPYFLILAIVFLFFYPVFLGKIPFPGDLLVGEYSPYNTNSHFGISPGGVPNKAQGFDVIRMIFPWKEFAVNSLASGSFPFWNPYNFSGIPFMANFQSGVFYPFNFIFLIFGNIYGWSVYVILQPILAGFFTFLFLRENNLSKESSFFGAITFALSSYMVVWIEYGNLGHAILWLPLILLLIDRNLKQTTWLRSLLLICSLTMSILAGYIQLTIYLFIFVICYLIFKAILQKKARKIAIFFPIFALPLLLTSVQLLSTYEVFSGSARTIYSKEVITKLLIPVWHIATTFVPDFFGNPATRNYWVDGTYIERVTYVGVLPLIFVLVAFLKKKKEFFWFFFGWAVFIYFLLLATPFGIFLNSLNIPFIGTGVPTRMMFLYFFSISVIAAIGLDIWLKERVSINRSLIILTIIYLAFWVFVFLAPRFLDYPWVNNLSITKKNLIIPSSLFFLSLIVLVFLKKSKKVFIVILIILLFDLLYFFNKITPFSPPEFFYPKTTIMTKLKEIQGINRSWGYGAGFLETNFQTHEKTFSPEGYDPLIVKSYIELVTSAKKGKFLKDIPRSI
ncbi:MAG: YfhO family protein, partial [Actinobacteria bacterium]|nr:YfhO family protein [Actinomycetota bacterium]